MKQSRAGGEPDRHHEININLEPNFTAITYVRDRVLDLDGCFEGGQGLSLLHESQRTGSELLESLEFQRTSIRFVRTTAVKPLPPSLESFESAGDD